MAEANRAVVEAPGPVVAGGAAAGAEGEQQQGGAGMGTWAMLKGLFFRLIMIYFVSSLLRGWTGQQSKTVNTTSPGTPGSVASYRPGRNLFPKGCSFDLYVYLSENEQFRDFSNHTALFWQIDGLIYGDWTSGPKKDGTLTFSKEIPTGDILQNNGSLYIHVYVAREGSPINPRDPEYKRRNVVYQYRRLNKYKRKKYQKTSNLLTGQTELSEDDVKKAETVKSEILSHWHPNLTLNLVDDQTAWSKGALPSPLDESVRFDPVTGDYYPIFYFNDYWNLGSEYIPLNTTVESVNLTLTYAPISLFKWQLYASQTMRNKWTQMLSGNLGEDGASDDDQDSLKQAILETNPYLLAATIVFSLLHTIFEFLAFKNDIQFWRSRKSLEGLSVRSVLFNLFTTLIVLLYVFDNDTNFVVRISIFIGLLIEMWKIPKVLDVGLDRENPLFGVIPRPRFADKGTYVESHTKEYDRLAFRYLSWILYPLLVGYAIYSLIYNEHRGWYSFILSMLYGFLLMFGFIMMTPQLFINYKLKSVAHLPWRMLSYKFLNTFIDDIFAFVIKMPTMYRIGCFRDDIVFLVYLYQRWIYRVDPTRVNEFGTTGEDVQQPAPIESSQGAIEAPGDGNVGKEGSVEPSLNEEQNGLIQKGSSESGSDGMEGVESEPNEAEPPQTESDEKETVSRDEQHDNRESDFTRVRRRKKKSKKSGQGAN